MTRDYLKKWRAKRRGKFCVECTNPVAAGRLTLCKEHSYVTERIRAAPSNIPGRRDDARERFHRGLACMIQT